MAFVRKLCNRSLMKDWMPCVGLVVLAGSFMLIAVPDERYPLPGRTLSLRAAPFTVVIDAGHGGADAGARANSHVEKELTLDVALRVESFLRQYGIATVLTRRDDEYVALEDRVAIANSYPNSAFVSIHFNTARQSSVSGIETFYARDKALREGDFRWIGFFHPSPADEPLDDGETLAAYIQAHTASRLDLRNRGIKKSGLYVVQNVENPAILIECGFLSNGIEAQLLRNHDYRQRLARGIAEGILVYARAEKKLGPPMELAQAGSGRDRIE